MLGRLAPPRTGRRLALSLGRQALRQPSRLRHRLNRHNLAAYRRFARREMRCNFCGHVGPLLYEMPDLELHEHHRIGVLRETLRCTACGAKMRDRTLAAGLLDFLGRRLGTTFSTVDDLAGKLPVDLAILETDAHSRLSGRLAAAPGFVRSFYLPDRPFGAVADDGRLLNLDLQDMSCLPDDSFDVVVTSEVLEHVRHVDKAHGEIARCLKPDGLYLFTVPYDASLERTWALIDPVTDEWLVDRPHIHGDPTLRSEGIKSYRVFGRDLVEELADVGLSARFCLVDRPDIGIFDGDLFLATPMTAPPLT